MTSVPGSISPGLWVLGTISTPGATGEFLAEASPTASFAPVGGHALKQYSSILGTIQLGKFMPGAILSVLAPLPPTGYFLAVAEPTADFGLPLVPGRFEALAEPIATFDLHKGPRYFLAVASPIATFEGRLIWHTAEFFAEAEPGAVFTPKPRGVSFFASAHPIANFYVRAGQPVGCITGPSVPPAAAPPNYVY